ncbi:type II toxin-antitoxin system PrlF family antitoxin [Sorangium sp. So ce834]|uniref:AbrB/MazE/SpoVT family DNA-binding domain-containing protein n=1 Tax=Sorangium sp. So ce834 TaxID=3133321 RepID=UPI003F5F5DC8
MSKIAVSRITSKGQTTIPETIRRSIGLQAGEQIEWTVTDTGAITIRKTGQSLDDLAKILPRPERALTVEEMDRAVAERFKEKRRVRR